MYNRNPNRMNNIQKQNRFLKIKNDLEDMCNENFSIDKLYYWTCLSKLQMAKMYSNRNDTNTIRMGIRQLQREQLHRPNKTEILKIINKVLQQISEARITEDIISIQLELTNIHNH